MKVISLSSNFCSDKKSAAVNMIEGRGRLAIAEAKIPSDVLEKIAHSTPQQIVTLNTKKNLIGSAVAGSLGGFNAHAANVITALFLATGQDVAQVVESASCITTVDISEDGALHITVTLPSLEVGTVGGGTSLPSQHASLNILGCNQQQHSMLPISSNQNEIQIQQTNASNNTSNILSQGQYADRLASIIAGAVLAGEISLLCALNTDDLVDAHITLNSGIQHTSQNNSSQHIRLPSIATSPQLTQINSNINAALQISSHLLPQHADSSGNLMLRQVPKFKSLQTSNLSNLNQTQPGRVVPIEVNIKQPGSESERLSDKQLEKQKENEKAIERQKKLEELRKKREEREKERFEQQLLDHNRI
ncbi:MAG: putative 3-hydroxy-3-methylglutaryl-coenzyme A reductase 1 [Streblomastix strix]|uniref:hydroxymethylglutaryl-CoA reductase (NADPH) n=1 Tax=Streblomastix strix TaxID=222440 RepID=A0A5J4U5T3_9EUKA|nr:MAG: putative 3-hydroxy-3-methylglutaryl-coenzyme A reductase 1 [Streblomastix strix]